MPEIVRNRTTFGAPYDPVFFSKAVIAVMDALGLDDADVLGHSMGGRVALEVVMHAPDRFGRCQTCGGEISLERLDALPHARLCITCKEKEEDEKRR